MPSSCCTTLPTLMLQDCDSAADGVLLVCVRRSGARRCGSGCRRLLRLEWRLAWIVMRSHRERGSSCRLRNIVDSDRN